MADTMDEEIRYHGKKIPGPVFRSWLWFCRDVAQRMNWQSEAALVLFYHPIEKTWGAYPPKQDLSSAFVDFSGVTEAVQRFREVNGKDWLMAGTLHSHPPGCNWASNTDEEDEEKLDGVHLIAPDWGRAGDKTVVAHVTSSKVRFKVSKPQGLLIDFSIAGEEKYPDEWMTQCKFEAKGERWRHRGHTAPGGSSHSSGGNSSVQTGNEFVYKGEGARSFKVHVNGNDLNILADQWKAIEPKVLLKKLGFGKSNRKFLMKNFEEDMKDLASAFDYVRESLEYVKSIRGDIVEHERKLFIDKAGEACKVMLESIESIGKRMIEQTQGAPPAEDASKEGEESEGTETAESGKEGEGKATEAAPVSSEETTDLREM